jgi:hypothetical protein
MKVNIALVSFIINVAGTVINAITFAVFHQPISAACAILSGGLAILAMLELEAQDVRDGKY